MKTTFRPLAIVMATIVAAIAFSAMAQIKYPQPILAENDYKWGYAIDRDKKQMVIDFIYDEAEEFVPETGQALVKFGNYWGVIDVGGAWQLDPIYDDVHLCIEYCKYIVKKDGKYGVLEPNGDVVFQLKFDNISATSNGWYEGELDGEWVYAHPDGRITTSYSEYRRMSNGN